MNKLEFQCRINLNIDSILCLIILNDGTIAAGLINGKIKLFNSKKYNNFLTIKEHTKGITSLSQSQKLKYKNIISTSKDSTIKIFQYSEKSYKIIQTICHNKKVNKFIELENNSYNFASCSDDGILNLYNINEKEIDKNKDNDAIYKEFYFNFNDIIFNMIETKENEIAIILSSNYHCLKFVDTKNKIIKKNISQISIIGINSICLFNKEYIIIGGSYMITVINIFNYSKQIIDVNSWKIYSVININIKEDKNIIAYSDDEGFIYFNEIVINEKGLNLKEIFNYINCYSISIFAMTFDKKKKILFEGGIRPEINMLKLF